MGAINVLKIAKRTKAKVLQASTSEIYGDLEDDPIQRQPNITLHKIRRWINENN